MSIGAELGQYILQTHNWKKCWRFNEEWGLNYPDPVSVYASSSSQDASTCLSHSDDSSGASIILPGRGYLPIRKSTFQLTDKLACWQRQFFICDLRERRWPNNWAVYFDCAGSGSAEAWWRAGLQHMYGHRWREWGDRGVGCQHVCTLSTPCRTGDDDDSCYYAFFIL